MNASAMKILFAAVAIGLAPAGCATQSTTYREMSGPAAPQTPAATYPIPAANPKGAAYVMSLGAEAMATPAGTQSFFLHLRIAAENKSDEVTWTIDAHDQLLTVGTDSQRPTYAQGSANGSVVTLAPGQRGALDVFYPLAPQGSPAQTTLSWQVRRGSDVFAATTPFDLQPSQSPEYVDYRPATVAVEYWPAGWWGLGFYNPWWWGPGWGWGYGPYGGYGYMHGGWGHGYGHSGSGMGWRGAPAGNPGAGGWRGAPPANPGRGGFHGAPPANPTRGFGGGGRGWRGRSR